MLGAIVLGAVVLSAVLGDAFSRGDDWVWSLPAGFPEPRVPESNPMSAEKVELGRHLFYEKDLSQNRTQSCASCHLQELAFTDGRVRAVGSTGEEHHRNALSLANVAYVPTLTWSSSLITDLERQAMIPLFGDDPVEMALEDHQVVVERLAARAKYREMFAAAFPADPTPISLKSATKALAAFQRTLISGDSPYDRYLAGDSGALSPSAKRGLRLFMSERLECFHCHGGFNFSDAFDHGGKARSEVAFHNTGLYNLNGSGAYPLVDRGLYEESLNQRDMGSFRAPTLRNIAVTAPYMHDGSIATLEEVIEHYAQGGRTLLEGPFAGDGSQNPHKSEFVVGFLLEAPEVADVLAFLRSLTDPTFLSNPAFAAPPEDDDAALGS